MEAVVKFIGFKDELFWTIGEILIKSWPFDAGLSDEAKFGAGERVSYSHPNPIITV